MTRRFAQLLAAGVLALTVGGSLAGEVVEPPWNASPGPGKNFTVPGIDNVPDLYGDVVDPDLVVFFAGNQYMVVHDLVAAFQAAHPAYRRVFVETLPPGVLIEQIQQGAITIGNLRITHKPDVFATGKGRMLELQRDAQWFDRLEDYASNRLAIMTALGNPQHISGWSDLADPAVQLCMPNPKWEGVARNVIIPALRTAGGDALVEAVYSTKLADGSTFLTHIHHRQTPLRIMEGRCGAGAVWYTEAYFHAVIKRHAVGMVELPDAQNRYATYTAGVMRDAPHAEAANAFVQFLGSSEGQAIYRKYGFLPAAPEGASQPRPPPP